MQNNYTINIIAGQVSLHFGASDPDKSGTSAAEVDSMATALISQLLREQFEPKKRHNMHLADAYQASGMTNGPDKAVRLATCARWLEFALPPEAEDKRYKITKTTSCHVRLCPVCQWRRSLNTYRNLARVYGDPGLRAYKHIFVTLTQKNVPGELLAEEIKRISDAYAAMMRRKPFKDLIKGYTRTIEVTRNLKTGEFHPHIHAIWTVEKNYGHKKYITQAALCQEWARALGADYVPVCDMRSITKLDGKSVAEVAKYSVKPSDYISDRLELTAEIIRVLDPALDGKRFVSYGGIIREIKQHLFQSSNLEDLEAETIPQAEWETWEKILYEWSFSEQRYKKITV
jgi:plasmid rolling circle replication initiator protein Rep